ncbi:uncharacterized protein LOC141695902 [Apium graveolens]|uniref:uncharacterized protein LOC141695902 n=1 Tax=Apium graveolens TaxID=4045 RepID=UPI003D7BA088
MVSQGSRRRIGNGESTRVWKVPWLPSKENGYLTTDMPQELEHIKVINLMETDSPNWDDAVLHDICTDRDVQLIKRIPTPLQQTEDSWFWILEESAVALAAKRVQIDQKCTWCLMRNEDATHVLFDCSFAREVWRNVGIPEVRFDGYTENIVDIFKQLVNDCPREKLAMIGIICWNLWNRRNRWVWDGVSISEFGV